MKIVKEYNEAEAIDVIEITRANYITGNIIEVFFNDGSNQVIDFRPFLSNALHPSISKYLDADLFNQFEIVNGNLNWNDYDLIFPIHTLHEGKIM
ncbi:MAG: DUF2442 domain-containing protein [Bacteroidota bacterium]